MIYVQASDTSHVCNHAKLITRRGDRGAIACVACGKRWVPQPELKGSRP